MSRRIVKRRITPPSAPVLAAALTVSETELDIVLQSPSVGTLPISTYALERSTNQNTWVAVASGLGIFGSGATYHDTALTTNTTYYYRCRATDSSGRVSPYGYTSGITSPPPNYAPVWLSGWSLDVQIGDFVSIAAYASDPNGDSLTFSRVGGTAPAGITVSQSGLVQVAVGVADGDYTLALRASDGVLTADTTVDVVVQSAGFNQWQDYSGNSFAGEPGALAVNDAWASTTYDYTPRYAPTIPAMPVYIPAPNTPATQRLVTSAAELTSAITAVNAGTVNQVFIRKGQDLHGMAIQTITRQASAGAPVWFVLYDHETPANNGEGLRSVEPWNTAYASRVDMPKVVLQNAQYVYFVGLNWGNYGVYFGTHWFRFGNTGGYTATNCLLYRCNMEGTSGGINDPSFPYTATAVAGPMLRFHPGANDNAIYQCVFQKTIPPGNKIADPPPNGTIFGLYGYDFKCINIDAAHRNRIVSSDFIDCFGGCIQVGSVGRAWGTIIEDCDMHKTRFWNLTSGDYTTGTYTESATGRYTAGEAFISIKQVGPAADSTDETTWTRIYGNRFSGSRVPVGAWDATTSTGSFIVHSGDTSPSAKFRTDMRWNVMEDAEKGCFTMQWNNTDIANLNANGGRHSVVRNVIYNVRTPAQSTTAYPVYVSTDTTEFYLNTINQTVTTGTAYSTFSFYRVTGASAVTHDSMGFLLIDTTTFDSTTSLTSSALAKFGYNCYVKNTTPTTYAKTYPVGPIVTKTAAGLGDFTYRVKKRYAPTTRTIPGVVPTSTTLTALGSWRVPTSGADQIGSRSGIGISEDY